MQPETRYARGPDGDVAYQIVSEGPLDLVFAPENYNNIEVMWEEPMIVRFFERLASFSRLIVFNFRGGGISDGLLGGMRPTTEQMADDLLAVLDAAESSRPFIVGYGAAGPIPGMLAAMHPTRVAGLVLIDSAATWRRWDDYPYGVPEELLEAMARVTRRDWGTGNSLSRIGPSLEKDLRFKRWYSRYERLSCGPAEAEANIRMAATLDFRAVLGTIRVPTLILCHTDDQVVRASNSRYLAEHIMAAQLVEVPGSDHLYFAGDIDPIIRAIHEFVTGAPEPEPTDRVLSTVLFTDIVGSTDRAAEVGDRRWHELLDSHDSIVRSRLREFRGREVKTTGDGVLATFDGPARAIRCASSICEDLRGIGIDIKVGIHTGEVEVRGEDIGGIAVHTAARVMSAARAGEVLVSRTVRDLVAGSGIEFDDRGAHELKGVPGEWRLFAVNM